MKNYLRTTSKLLKIKVNSPRIQGVSRSGSARFWALCLLLALMLLSGSLWAEVSAQLNRTTVYEGDSLVLTLERNSLDAAVAPDLTPLEKDFQVLGTGTGTQVQIINGHRSDKRQWHITLRPLHLGVIEVPAIRIGGEITQPLRVSVIETPQSVGQAVGGNAANMLLESHVENPEVYLQQQIRYVTRLYYRVPLLQGQLSDPEVANAVVERLGDDRKYITERDGVEYNVIERSYGIFPEKSGELRIPPVRFQGAVELPGQQARPQRPRLGSSFMEDFFGRDPFDDPFFNSMRQRGEEVALKSRGVTVKVKPQPQDYRGQYWIPAASVVLEDSWVDELPTFKVGEPVTRTVTLIAKGLTASQLPELTLKEAPGFSVYPEKPITESRTDGDWVYAVSKLTVTYVPTREGLLSVPEESLDWWDTQHGKQAITTLNGWKVQVAPGELTEEPGEEPADEPQAVAPAQKPAAAAPQAEGENVQEDGFGLMAGILALLLLLFGGVFWWLRRRSPALVKQAQEPVQKAGKAPGVDRGQALKALEQATSANDPVAASRALLELAKATWPENPPASLGALAERVANGSEALAELDAALYKPGASAWDGQALWQVFGKGLKARTASCDEAEDALPPLYPR